MNTIQIASLRRPCLELFPISCKFLIHRYIAHSIGKLLEKPIMLNDQRLSSPSYVTCSKYQREFQWYFEAGSYMDVSTKSTEEDVLFFYYI